MNKHVELLKKVQGLYGDPSGLTEERRKAYYSLDKSPADITRELKSIENDVSANFYVLPVIDSTLVVLDA